MKVFLGIIFGMIVCDVLSEQQIKKIGTYKRLYSSTVYNCELNNNQEK